MEEKLIMDHSATMAKLERMAWEIYENHFQQTTLGLAGIEGLGVDLAHVLKYRLESICPLTVSLFEIPVKSNPLS